MKKKLTRLGALALVLALLTGMLPVIGAEGPQTGLTEQDPIPALVGSSYSVTLPQKQEITDEDGDPATKYTYMYYKLDCEAGTMICVRGLTGEKAFAQVQRETNGAYRNCLDTYVTVQEDALLKLWTTSNSSQEVNFSIVQPAKIRLGQEVTVTLESGQNEFYTLSGVSAGTMVGVMDLPDTFWCEVQSDDHNDCANKYAVVGTDDPWFTIWNESDAEKTVTFTVQTMPEIAPGESKTLTVEAGRDYYYKLTGVRVGTFIGLKDELPDGVSFGLKTETYGDYFESGYCPIREENTKVCLSCDNYSGELTFALASAANDSFEPNNTQSTAKMIGFNSKVDFVTNSYDDDWFYIQTANDAQDIELCFTGFSAAQKGYFNLYFDGVNVGRITSNATVRLHATKAGNHYIRITNAYSNTADGLLRLSMTPVPLSQNDTAEPNDTKETATKLEIGIDKYFSMGGYGDEDWFWFETDGVQKMHSLHFIGLNPDYSDEFVYDVVASDGTKVVSGVSVNIQHTGEYNCPQSGKYYVRVYCNDFETPRSSLRIRVDYNVSDPSEPNDTWQEAHPVNNGTTAQFMLPATSDTDWFRIESTEQNATLKLTHSGGHTAYKVYSGETLAEYGEDYDQNGKYNYITYSELSGERVAYIGLSKPGVYYVKTWAQSNYQSGELRVLTFELLSPDANEPNDSYKNATLMVEGIPVDFRIDSDQDIDWFKIHVPANTTKLTLYGKDSNYSDIEIYRAYDFETKGENAPYLKSYSGYGETYYKSNCLTLDDPAADTYYIKVKYGPNTGELICYLGDIYEPDSTMEAAETLAPDTWSEAHAGMQYYALGALNYNDVISVIAQSEGENAGCEISLHDATTRKDSFRTIDGEGQNGAYGEFEVPGAGSYYLCVTGVQMPDADTGAIEITPVRVKYTVRSQGASVTGISGPDAVTMQVGEYHALDLHLAPENAYDYWRPFKFSLAHGDEILELRGGTLYAKAPGTETVTVTYCGNSNIKKDITVTVGEQPTAQQNFQIANAPQSLQQGARHALELTLMAGDENAAFSWSSSDPTILHVDAKGVLTAVKPGSATITAASGAKQSSVVVTVVPAQEPEGVSNLVLNTYQMTLYVNEAPGQLTATVLPESVAETYPVTWSSTNLQVATVDENGTVTAVAPGVVMIRAEAGGFRSSCTVTVYAPREKVTGISFAETEHEMLRGSTYTLTPIITPDNATTQTVLWSSEYEDIAVVSRSGIVTALAVGETTITATTVDGGFTATVKITVTATPQIGDVSGDGYVDAGDAVLILQASVGNIELTEAQLAVADVNKDTYIDAGDAIRILRYDAGLIQTLQ